MTEPNSRPRTARGDDELVLAALGGLGEIGMNTYLYGLGPPRKRTWLMVDLGVTFPSPEEPGVDVVLPDLEFIEGAKGTLAGLVLTHAHEDHIGAVIDLWPRLNVPIYATPFTAGMLRSKLVEFGGKTKLPITEVALGSRFKVGPFDVEYIDMAHSIPEPSGLVLRTSLGTVFHTGDWKLDDEPYVGRRTDVAKIEALRAEGVRAVVCDSTNAMREGRSPSEGEIARSLETLVARCKKRVVVTSFASNVARIRAVAQAAAATGRTLVIAGRAMHRVVEVAIETGYLPKNFTWHEQDQFAHFPPDKVIALVTGSQGEARAALARIGENDHPAIKLGPGDTAIFSSRAIPGNEKAVGRVQNNLARLGVEVITDNEALVHVTGHPRREELKQMYQWLKPELAVPMHGEVRHLMAHAKLAREQGVKETITPLDGEVARLAPGPAELIGEIPVGRLYRDGNLIVPGGEGPVRERRKLAFVGLVAVAFALGKKGEMVGEPEVAIDGVPWQTADGDDMEDVVLDALEGTLKSIPPARRKDVELVREAVRRAVRSAIEQIWGKKPIVKVLITGG